MPIHVFRATDAGAPSITGVAGSGIAVLDAVLVDGYNTKTITLARSGSTVTATSTAHGYVLDQVVLISGADQADYNGLHKVTSAAANTFTFEIETEPATPATGTISCKVAPLGWTKPYSGTNIAVYRQPTGTSNGFYLRVDDSTGNGMRVRGFEAMSDVNTGTGPFPTVAQQADPGLYWWKSAAANSTVRAWSIYSDGKFLNWVIGLNATSASDYGSNYTSMWHFGDMHSLFSGDSYGCVIGGSVNANANNAASQTCILAYANTAASGGSYYVAREYTGAGSAISIVRVANAGIGNHQSAGSSFGSNGPLFPNQTDGNLYMSDVFYATSTTLRGKIPGLICPLHFKPYAHGTRFQIGDDFYFCQEVSGSAPSSVNNGGMAFIKVTGEW